jgi:predicted nucleotidyltransferase
MGRIYTLKYAMKADMFSLLELIDRFCTQLDLRFLLAGPMARDLVLHHVLGLPLRSKKDEIELAILMPSWDAFLETRPFLTGNGMDSTETTHRLEDVRSGLSVDFIPFGVLAMVEEVRWSQRHNVILSVARFYEAFRASMKVDIGSGIILNIASLSSLAVFKLMAWGKKSSQGDRIARDFLEILCQYGSLHRDRLFGDDFPSKQLEPNQERRGAFLLGYDLTWVVPQKAKMKLEKIKAEKEEQLIKILGSLDSRLGGMGIKTLMKDFWSGVNFRDLG